MMFTDARGCDAHEEAYQEILRPQPSHLKKMNVADLNRPIPFRIGERLYLYFLQQSYLFMAELLSIKWLNEPEDHNYPAAFSYLSLIYDEGTSAKMVDDLKAAPISQFKAKDIFRSSSLSLLGVSNSHVNKDRKKIKKGTSLSPILLVRDTANGKVVIADGYHRMCAVYSFDEDAVIPCKIV